MKWYTPPKKEVWKGRNDGSRNYQLVQCVNLLKPLKLERGGFGLLGFACDEGVKRNQGRPGAKKGPAAFIEAFAGLPTLNKDIHLYDCGTITCETDNFEEAQDYLANAVALLLQQDVIPIVIGGGHELAWGQFIGYVKAKQQSCRIINFDAHYDIRPLQNGKGNSGTSFRQIYDYCQHYQWPFDYTCVGISKGGNTLELHESAKEMKAKVVFAEDIHTQGDAAFSKTLQEGKDPIYLSLCLDVFAAAHAPGVSAPQPLGLAPWDLIPALLKVMKTGNVKMIGVAELAPEYDRDGVTAKLAAQIVNMLIAR